MSGLVTNRRIGSVPLSCQDYYGAGLKNRAGRNSVIALNGFSSASIIFRYSVLGTIAFHRDCDAMCRGEDVGTRRFCGSVNSCAGLRAVASRRVSTKSSSCFGRRKALDPPPESHGALAWSPVIASAARDRSLFIGVAPPRGMLVVQRAAIATGYSPAARKLQRWHYTTDLKRLTRIPTETAFHPPGKCKCTPTHF
jgi:hypothetical protein